MSLIRSNQRRDLRVDFFRGLALWWIYTDHIPGDVLGDYSLRNFAMCDATEVFVLLADLLELDDHLDPLLRAVRVALGRHHQVMLICPWPPGLELPPSALDQSQKRKAESGSRIFPCRCRPAWPASMGRWSLPGTGCFSVSGSFFDRW